MGTPLHQQEWVRTLLAREVFTAEDAAHLANKEFRCGPDLIARLRKSRQFTVTHIGDGMRPSGHRIKIYSLWYRLWENRNWLVQPSAKS